MKKIFLIILITFSNSVIGKEGGIFDCSSKVGLGLDLLDNIYSYKDQGIHENFKLKLNSKEINFESGKIKRNYRWIPFNEIRWSNNYWRRRQYANFKKIS